MGYRKFRGSRLFDGYRFRDDEVLVTDGDGVVVELITADAAGSDVESLEGILSPGLVNCHCHSELSHMKGLIPRGTGLVGFVGQVMANRFRPDEEILAAIQAAEEEMLTNGIVAVGDICNTANSIGTKKSGKMAWYNFIEVSGFDPAMAAVRFNAAKDIAQKFEEAVTRVRPMPWSIVPHSPYSVSAVLWEMIVQFAGNKLLSMHNQEDPAENDFFIRKEGAFLALYEKMKLDLAFFQPSGESSIRTCLTRFPPGQSLILVHNVYTSAADFDYIKQLSTSPSLYWCLCPRANQYISNAIPDVPLLVKDGRRIVLGTDSLASNEQLDIMSEISIIHNFYPDIPDTDLLTWATSNGAMALQMDDRLGSFEKGKKPGVVLINERLTRASRIL